MALILNSDDERDPLGIFSGKKLNTKKSRLKTQTEPERFGSGTGGSNRPPRKTSLGYMGEDEDFGHDVRKLQSAHKVYTLADLQLYAIWKNKHEIKQKHKHSIDLLPPPLGGSEISPIELNQDNLKNHFSWIKKSRFSGILKYKSLSLSAQGAMVLYRGMCLGCVFHSKDMPQDQPTDIGLQKLFECLAKPAVRGFGINTYSLPEKLILSISASFLGFLVQSPNNMNIEDFFEYLSDWIEKQQSTGNAVLFSNREGALFVYFYKGRILGTFLVNEQSFSKNPDVVSEFFKRNQDIIATAAILPEGIQTDAQNFGYDLSLLFEE